MSTNGLLSDEELLEVVCSAGFDVAQMSQCHSGGEEVDLWIVEGIPNDGWWDAWERLRGLVDVTGRFPVLACSPGTTDRGRSLRNSFASNESAAEMLAQSEVIDVWPMIRSSGAHVDETVPDRFVGALSFCFKDGELEGILSRARRALPADASSYEIQEWAVADRWHTFVNERTDDHWQENQISGHVESPCAVLIPTTDPVAGLAYVASFGAREPAQRVAVMRDLHSRYGVEYVGEVGIHDLFLVPRRPTEPKECFMIAHAISSLWPDTDGGYAVWEGTPLHIAGRIPTLRNWAARIRP